MIELPTPEESLPNGLPTDIKRYIKQDILAGLPEFTKHPKNYEKIQRALLETLTCGKLHSDPAQALHCIKCSENMATRRQLMKKFGFKSPAQYMQWRRVHEEVKRRVPLDMYNRIVADKN